MGPEGDTDSASRNPQPDEGDEKHKNSINIFLFTFDFEALPGMIFLTASISEYKYSWSTKFITPKAPRQSLGLPTDTEPSITVFQGCEDINQDQSHFVHM